MKTSIRFKINRLIAVALVVMSATMISIALFVVNSFSITAADSMMSDALKAQALRLNNWQKDIEKSVQYIYEISMMALADSPGMETEEEIKAFLDAIKSSMLSIANSTEGSMAVYYRLSPEICGDGKQGFFYVRESKEGVLQEEEITDLLAYDEDDNAHVGWYYEPIKAGQGVWMSPYYNANIDVTMISYVLPVFAHDRPFGVVGMDVDIDSMIAIAENVEVFDSGGASLVDPETGMVYYKNCDLFAKGISKELMEDLRGSFDSQSMISITEGSDKYRLHFTTLNNGMKLIIYASNSEVFGVSGDLIRYGLLVFAVIFFLTIFTAIRLSNRITNPIKKINAATKEYANGNWDVTLSCDTDDELAELTDSVSLMAESIKSNLNNLRDALAVARDASEAKSKFLSNMSHDIRTPMNAIISYSDFSLAQENIPDEIKDYLLHIKQAGNHLMALINSVLDMSRIESGKTKIDEIPCNIRELVTELGNIVYADASKKNQEIVIDTSGIANENIMCDSLRFNQVLINLLGNAVKFTGNGGKITVTATEDKGFEQGKSMYHFSVKDTGMGIDEAFLDHIFDPFERESNSTISGIQGTGLGLAISKNLVEMMGGIISVKSKKGEGTEFLIDIMFKHNEDEMALQGGNRPDDKEDLPENVDISGLRILLVEDNKVNRLIVNKILSDKVALLEEATDGKEAVETIAARGAGYYSLILMDIQMPNMDGLEATRQIRNMEDSGIKNIPIIAMSANAFEEDKRNAINAGMDGYITKPIDVELLIKTIAALGE